MNQASLDLLSQYYRKLESERRLSANTLKNYQRDLNNLCRFCDAHSVENWRALDTAMLRQYVSQHHRQGLSGKSLQRQLSAFRTFFRFLLSENQLELNPATDIQAPRVQRKLPDTLDVDRMSRLMAIEGDEPLLLRDRAILELFYSSGLRLSELVSLDLADVDLKEKQLRVTGKGNKSRQVPVGRQAVQAIERWLKARNSLQRESTRALFLSRHGRRISVRNVQQRVRHWAKKQGIDVRVYPHLLRHSFASHILESSQDLRAVQELLGHANISTTQIYTHLDFQHLAAVYDDAHPRARKRRKQREK